MHQFLLKAQDQNGDQKLGWIVQAGLDFGGDTLAEAGSYIMMRIL